MIVKRPFSINLNRTEFAQTLLWSAQIHDDMEEETISPLEWVSIFGTSFLFMAIFFLLLPPDYQRLSLAFHPPIYPDI